MADIETISILKVGTDEAVRNIADLKANIKALKEELNNLEIGTGDYQKKLAELEDNQAALKNAMHGTATSMEQIAAAAKGQDESYNGLVRTMAKYKEELRAIDTSTEEGKTAFKNKAEQIKNVNDKLKELDAMQGNYQRNVGNYKSAVEGLGTAFRSAGGSAAAMIAPVQSVTTSLKTLSATPVLGVLGLLAVAFNAVASGIKSSEENTNAINRAFAAFKPIADSVRRGLQEVGEAVGKLANGFSDLLIQWGLLDEEAARHRQNMESQSQATRKIAREILVANAQLEADVAAAREIATDKENYTRQQRIDALKKAQWAEEQIAKNNMTLAQRRLEAAQAEAAVAQNDADANDRLAEAIANVERVRTAAANSRRTIQRQINAIMREGAGATKEKVEAEREELETIPQIPAALSAAAQQVEAAQSYMDRATEEHVKNRIALHEEEVAREKELNEARVEAAFGYAAAVSDILGSIAEIYEANGDADEKSAQKAKALRTAEAVISTISGAISAYMNTIESIKIPAVAIPLAAVNAAAVLAAGMANVKKIQATKVGSGGATASAAVSAPAFSPAVSQVRTITGASEEERLNRMAADNRVYLVYSDIERANTATRVRVQETEF